MNKKSFLLLIVAAVVLGAVFCFTRPDYQKTGEQVRLNLFEDNLAEKVSRMTVEKGEESIEVAVHDNRWSLPGRDNFPADSGKVNSFLLKFFSLAVTQRVTSDADKYEKFGLSDEAVKAGKAVVSFYDAADALLGKVYLGERRKGNAPQMSPNMPFAGGNMAGVSGGQYIRREGEAGVYLSDEPIAVQTALRDWFDQSIVNVLSANSDRIEHYALSADAETLQYALNRIWKENTADPAKKISEWVLEKAEADKADAAAVSLVSTGLQNLRMDDVYKEGTEQVADLTFDMLSRYLLSNGLRYDIVSAAKDDKTFVKVAVSFDVAYAETLKAKKEEELAAAKAKFEAAKKAKEEAVATEKAAEKVAGEADKVEAVVKADKPVEVPKVAPLVLANAEDAAKSNYRYEAWVYVLPEYLGKKFRQDADLIVGKGKVIPAEGAPVAAAPIGAK